MSGSGMGSGRKWGLGTTGGSPLDGPLFGNSAAGKNALHKTFGLWQPPHFADLDKLGDQPNQFLGAQVSIDLVGIPVPTIDVVIHDLLVDRLDTQAVLDEVVGNVEIESDVILDIRQVVPRTPDAVGNRQGSLARARCAAPFGNSADHHGKAQRGTDGHKGIDVQVRIRVENVEGDDRAHRMGDQYNPVTLVFLHG